MNKMRIAEFTLLFLTPAIFSACGGGGNSNPPVENTGFVIGGTVTGLVNDKQVVLQNNGEDELKVIQNGKFAFSKTIASGANYSVTVKTPPDGLNCAVEAGSGQAIADVDTIKVKCSPIPVADITQLAGKWYQRDYCRMVLGGGLYGKNGVEITMSGNMPTVTYQQTLYGSSDCSTEPMGGGGAPAFATEKVRSTFVHEGIAVFRLSLFMPNEQWKLRHVFWIPPGKNSICLMVDDEPEKTDEALAKEITGILYPEKYCYIRVE